MTHPGPALRAVVFDLDGTLVDTADDFIPAVQQLREEFGRPTMDPTRIRRSVSNGARALVRTALDLGEDDAAFEHWRQRLLALYAEQLGRHARLYPGLRELLLELEARDIAWGIATNKPRVYTLPLLTSLGLTLATDRVICPEDVREPKPHPEGLLKLCDTLACGPESMIYAGDHRRDIEAGRRAGTYTIAAAYGYIETGDNPEDWQAHGVADDSHALCAMIRG